MKRLLACCLMMVGCASQKEAQPEEKPAPVQAPPPPPKLVIDASKPLPPGLDEASFDLKADPCADFYQYACGGWMASTPIPDDRDRYSRGFIAITERNDEQLKAICEEAVAGKLDTAQAPFAKKLADYYGSCIDDAKVEKGADELRAFLKTVLPISNPAKLSKALGVTHLAGFSPLFDFEAMQDLTDSSQVIGGLSQSGLGMPDRDYYLKDDEKTVKVRTLYVEHMQKMFALYGLKPDAVKKASDDIMALETRLAKASLTRVEMRDPTKLNNRVERKGLEELAPDIKWGDYLAALGVAKLTAINATSKEYVTELGKVAKETKPEVLDAYFTWAVMRSMTTALPKKFQDERFSYESQALSGAKVDRPRWKKCVELADRELPHVLGREFVRRHFGEDGKARTSAMVVELQNAVKADIDALPWMDPDTKAKAQAKLSKMTEQNKIGYPDVWRDYSKLTTSPKSFFANRLAARKLESVRQVAKIGKPVDRAEWLMSPPTVNAYNDGQKNEIVFPAGILQPPFFNREATDWVNFGAMGMVVGHEITHGFDDEGRKFDVDGSLRDWWTPASSAAFEQRVACVKEQFDGYVAVDDLKLDGKLTLGENTADLGGLKLAYLAMQQRRKTMLTKEPQDQYRYDPAQQFFLGMAQSWCTKVRDEAARVRVATDPHAPPYWRVNGPLSNLTQFREAFKCAEGSKMVRTGPKRCEVW